MFQTQLTEMGVSEKAAERYSPDQTSKDLKRCLQEIWVCHVSRQAARVYFKRNPMAAEQHRSLFRKQ